MEFQTLLQTRRSIRKFRADAVSKDTVLDLIKAASEAPSWKNTETGRYYCVLSPDMADRVRKCMPSFNQASSANAALIVSTFVKGCSGFQSDGTPTNEIGDGWGCYDLGLQNENLVLKAAELGLGTLIMGIRDSDSLRKLLSIPDSEIIVSVIAVGYPDITPDRPVRKAPEDIAVFF